MIRTTALTCEKLIIFILIQKECGHTTQSKLCENNRFVIGVKQNTNHTQQKKHLTPDCSHVQ